MSLEKKDQRILLGVINSVIKEELSKIKENYEGELPGIAQDYHDSMVPGVGGGSGHGSSGLKQAFIDPFTDIAQTAMYSLKTISAAARGYLKRILAGTISLFIPFVHADYKAMRNDEDKELAKIKSQYAPVLARNMEALRQNDVWLVSFLLDPGLLLGAQLLRQVPAFTGNILSMAGIDIGTMKEEVTDPSKIKSQFLKSSVAKQMQKDGIMLVLDHVKKFMAIQTVDQLLKVTGNALSKPVQAIDALVAQRKITEQEKQVMLQQMLVQAKAEYKKFYVKQMQDFAVKHPDSKSAVSSLIQQIQALK